MAEIKTFGEIQKIGIIFRRLGTSNNTACRLKPLDTITARVRRELEHKGHQSGMCSTGYMMGVYSLTWSAVNGAPCMLATRHSIEEAISMPCAPNDAPDFPSAPAFLLTILNDVSNVHKLPQAYVEG